MPKTYLQIVNAAQQELGLPVSTTVNDGGTGTQMGALANRVLDELRRMHVWTAQQTEFNLVVSAPVITTGDMVAQSAVITNLGSTTNVTAGAWSVSGSGIPAASRVSSLDSATQITMTMENTNTTNITGTQIILAHDTFRLPTDFDWFQNRTMWDRTNRWELLGPDSPQMDQWHRSGIVATGPRRHFRQVGPIGGPSGRVFRLWPAPTEIVNPLQLVFEYISINTIWVSGSGSTFAQYFVNDADVPLLDDQAIIMGVKWLFWEAKGFGSYVTMQSRWVDYVDRLIARDGAAPTLSLVKRVHPIFVSPANVQDGFFPGPVGPNMA